MKSVIAVLVAIAVGFGAGYYILSKKHSEKAGQQAAAETDLQSKVDYLEQALAEAKKRQGEVRTVTRTTSTTITNKLSAQEILERLVKLNPNTGDESRNRTLRQVVYHLQLLAELGPAALPTIQTFLKETVVM